MLFTIQDDDEKIKTKRANTVQWAISFVCAIVLAYLMSGFYCGFDKVNNAVKNKINPAAATSITATK
jgi:hypothetical protein